ncbi:phosphoglycolate phosphatase [Desulfoluna limicola]|uniref:phosphoglycolate phosphatase n=1 Tax=Desulfoluna limicola TaxID=2810562 RepID=A0ABM7PJ09_9BACT|nr:HAD family hydrolase [Desulfoluna limicola]BCS97062.1 phosphoglycolate phosphatase [Desulfoluna limicola]
MTQLKAVFFDVDGVLLDSLPPHLAICRDLNIRYGLGLQIPDAEAFKQMARSGVPISPMEAFFKAVGFSEEMSKKGDTEYRTHFTTRYEIPLFQGVDRLLKQLSEAGLHLGIVTANTFANIQKPLGSTLSLFHPNCIFTHDAPGNSPKAQAILLGSATLGIAPSELLFVGDQPSDHRAAVEANAPFLGVTYGWGISKESTNHPTAESPDEIIKWVSHLME